MFKICHNHSYISQQPPTLSPQLLPVRVANILNALSSALITPSLEQNTKTGYLGLFLLGMCRWPLRAATPFIVYSVGN